jgi:phosphoserine / homoserine phosphotransferase
MIACLDLEGVLLPEIWIKFAEKTGVEDLKLTTRDIPDYDELMTKRLNILKENNYKLENIKEVISTLKPLDGAIDFHNWLKSEFQVIILSDTFYQFVSPLMKQLDYPTLFCHQLVIDRDDSIVGYKLRQPNGKQEAVKALQNLNFKVVAAGDSYNDIEMLKQADEGILFDPPKNVISDYPQFSVSTSYADFQKKLQACKVKFKGASED